MANQKENPLSVYIQKIIDRARAFRNQLLETVQKQQGITPTDPARGLVYLEFIALYLSKVRSTSMISLYSGDLAHTMELQNTAISWIASNCASCSGSDSLYGEAAFHFVAQRMDEYLEDNLEDEGEDDDRLEDEGEDDDKGYDPKEGGMFWEAGKRIAGYLDTQNPEIIRMSAKLVYEYYPDFSSYEYLKQWRDEMEQQLPEKNNFHSTVHQGGIDTGTGGGCAGSAALIIAATFGMLCLWIFIRSN